MVPDVSVNESISLNLPQYNNLNFINGWVYTQGGYNGLLAVRVSTDVINVYDRQAPYRTRDGCRVIVDTGATTCTDTCSGSQWLLLDGQIIKGPASYPLKQYQSQFDGTTLTVTN
jgi:hypothetical protein